MSRNQPCEMCGAESPVTLVEIDRVKLYACARCAKFGTPVQKKPEKRPFKPPTAPRPTQRSSPKPERQYKPPKKDFLHDKILVDGYGEIIQNARRDKGLGRAEFAQLIKEKETLLARIEAEKVLPTDIIIAKIERELGIELKTEITDEKTIVDDFIPKATTIGSIAKIKRKKQEKSSEN
ncbi:multiprotein bridging factor aMBF1 [Candidatus Hodarchaeum mangrovi]